MGFKSGNWPSAVLTVSKPTAVAPDSQALLSPRLLAIAVGDGERRAQLVLVDEEGAEVLPRHVDQDGVAERFHLVGELPLVGGEVARDGLEHAVAHELEVLLLLGRRDRLAAEAGDVHAEA